MLEDLLKGNIAGFKKAVEANIAEKVFVKLAEKKQELAQGLYKTNESVSAKDKLLAYLVK